MDDHNPCPLLQIHGFCGHVHNWLGGARAGVLDRVAAIHCKGGKGRTGTMICCYLMHSGAVDDFSGPSAPDNALAYFASRRTDSARGSTYQGVQTPSQARFIRYYGAMLGDSVLEKQIREDPPVFIVDSARIVNAAVPESVRDKVRKESESSETASSLLLGKDGVPGNAFTMLVYDGMDAVRLRKKKKKAGAAGGEGKDDRADPEDLEEGEEGQPRSFSEDTAKPVAVIPTRVARHGKYGTFDFDLEALPELLHVRGDVKIRILSPWRLPGKKYDDCFVYFWFHTSFLHGGDGDGEGTAASIAEANMPASGGVAGDGGVSSVGTSDVRADPDDPENGVILTLSRDRLDNGHHKPNRQALSENFAVEIKFRRVPGGAAAAAAAGVSHHPLGGYRPKLFDPPSKGDGGGGGGGGAEISISTTGVSREVGGRQSDGILNVQSPWSRK